MTLYYSIFCVKCFATSNKCGIFAPQNERFIVQINRVIIPFNCREKAISCFFNFSDYGSSLFKGQYRKANTDQPTTRDREVCRE